MVLHILETVFRSKGAVSGDGRQEDKDFPLSKYLENSWLRFHYMLCNVLTNKVAVEGG